MRHNADYILLKLHVTTETLSQSETGTVFRRRRRSAASCKYPSML